MTLTKFVDFVQRFPNWLKKPIAALFLGVNSEREYNQIYRLGRTLWLFLGLAWLSTVIAVKQNTIQEFIRKEERKFKSYGEKEMVKLNWPTYHGK